MELNTLLSEEQYDQEIEEKNETITNSVDQVKETDEKKEIFLSYIQITKNNSADQEKEDREKDKIVLPPLKIINKNTENLEDDDGFKTPTSMDQRISKVPLQCPPAPVKPKSIALKRKASHYVCNCQRRIILDADIADEVQVGSMFPKSQVDGDLGAIKTKRSRK